MSNPPRALDAPQTTVTLIGSELIRQAVEASRRSPRRRIILPLHKGPEASLHRMLNAVQPHSYVQPHRHLQPPKAESLLVLQGALLTVIFSDSGRVEQAMVLAAGSACFGIDLEPGVFHTFLALQPDTVLFEVKPGPYEAPTDKDFALWAPAENSKAAAGYLAELYRWAERHGWPVPGKDASAAERPR